MTQERPTVDGGYLTVIQQTMTTKKPTVRIGRPVGSVRTDRSAIIPAVRCTPEQRATWDSLGGADWQRAVLTREDDHRTRAEALLAKDAAGLRLIGGELTMQEIRAVRAFLRVVVEGVK